MTTTRLRRTLAAGLATTLAAISLAGTAPSADAVVTDGNPDASITPSSVQPGSTRTFTVTVEGTDAAKAQVVTVAVPATFGSPTSPSTSAPSGWTASYASGTRTFTFSTAQSNNKLGSGQSVSATITAVAPASSGAYTWPVGAKPNDNNNAAAITVSPQPVVTVGNPAQSITFAPLPDRTFGDPDFTVSATGGASGNPVTFTTSGACTNGSPTNATIHLVGAGSCSVRADQAGGNGYQAAASVTRTFSIAKGSQTISFGGIGTRTYGDAPLPLTATASSGLPVSYATEGPCSVTGAQLSLTGAGTCTVTANQAGNADWNAAAPAPVTFSITKASATLSLDDLSHEYDGEAHRATASTTPSGLDGVTVTYSRDGAVVTDPIAAGSYDVIATLDNADYAAETVLGTLVIAPRHVTGAFTVAGRDYDGTTAATVLTRTVPGTVAGDDVSLSGGTATFDLAGAGLRTATLSGAALEGSDAANYVLDGVTTTTATIAPKPVTGEVVAADKTYDGTTSATATPQLLAGRVGSDDVEVVVDSATFDGKDVAEGRTVTAALHLAGDDADNYVLTSGTATALANIWAKALTGSFTAAGKTYDATRIATVTPAALEGLVAGETVTLVVGTPMFDTKDVGTHKAVTGTLSLGGEDAGNYVLDPASSDTAYADITEATVHGAITAADRTYDGTRNASVTPQLTGAYAGDDVTTVASDATFDSKDVGTRTATATLSLSGADAGNYVLASTTAADDAEITAKQVTGRFTAADKQWDGTTAASIASRSLDGALAGDDVSLAGGSASFADPSVGNGKPVSGTGFTLAGADRANYVLASTTLTATASITPLYSGKGFFAPVDMTPAGASTRVFNTIKGGQTVPLKFELFNAQSGVEQTSLSALGQDAAAQASAFKATTVSCTATAATEDAVELTTTGATAVRYDTSAGQYIQNWKTPSSVGTCYAVSVRAVDGTTVGAAYFKILK